MKPLLLIITLLSGLFTFSQVSPFLTTAWNQTCNYNANCPTVGSGGACGKAYTGCNATAMAQIFKYYSYPATGWGSHCNSNAPTACADFSLATYDYALMPNVVSSANAEVAMLMYDLGVSVDMMWSGTSSNSFFTSDPFKRYFKYSPKIYGTAAFMFNTTAELIAGIKLELDAGRPVFAKGGNHFYLIDGYNTSDQFHMNFGWGGTYDGYYAINNVVNGAGTFTPGNFIFQIEPINGDLETANDTIVVPASANSNQSLEFSSLLPWTASVQESWLSLGMTSGAEGYFNFNDGSVFGTTINHGGVRYGHILIDNGNDIDTIVIQQNASPLQVNPSLLTYTSAGVGQNATLTCESWMNWTATTSDTWIIAPASGTGSSNPTIACSVNTGAARNGFVKFMSGSFIDTVFVEQEAGSSASLLEGSFADLKLFPNPTSDFVYISYEGTSVSYSLRSMSGQLVKSGDLTSTEAIDLTSLQKGLYIIEITLEDQIITRRIEKPW